MWLRRTKKPRTENIEAARALVEAQRHLNEVEERTTEVHQVAEASKKLRRENHFAMDLQKLFEGGAR